VAETTAAAPSGTANVEAGVPALRLQGGGPRFGALVALDDVTLDVPPGERRAIIGPNGAGKTTLFNVVMGDHKATTGTIHFFGEDVTRLAPQARARRGLTRTYQTSLLFGGLTVADNLYLAVRGVNPNRFSMLRARAGDRYRELAAEVGERVNLTALLDVSVSNLSHGEQRQLEVGMALAGNPKVILLDEPAAGLSPGERSELRDLLRSLPAELTYVIIEHDMDIALQVSEHVTVMHEGQVVVDGTPREIAANQIVQDIYLGRHGNH
jgi:branched-chain amino acid transport system ATP-binding protein